MGVLNDLHRFMALMTAEIMTMVEHACYVRDQLGGGGATTP